MKIDTTEVLGKTVAAKLNSKALNRASLSTEKQTLRVIKTQLSAMLNAQEIFGIIAITAYLRAEQRGFKPGHDLEDWLEAEQLVHATYQ